METVLDVFERGAERYGDRPALALRADDGTSWSWSYRELDRRARAAAWRLRALGLEPGDRILTWSPSTPALVAAYAGAMRARLVYVPLDLRMAPSAIEAIVARTEPRLLVLGSGKDAPDPAEAGLERFPTILVEHLAAEPGAAPTDADAAAGRTDAAAGRTDAAAGRTDAAAGRTDAAAAPAAEPTTATATTATATATAATAPTAPPTAAGGRHPTTTSFPVDWEEQLARWERPLPADVYQLVFTSGTTGTPKGVMIAHEGTVATIAGIHGVIPPLEHRLVSVLPLSHLYEQIVGCFYPLDIGASVLYVRSRTPRVLIEAIREFRTTSMASVPAALDLLWDGLLAEVGRQGRERQFGRLRALARLLPFGARRLLFRSIHRRFLGTHFRLFVSIGAYLPPSLQLAWEELGIVVLQGYGATETAFGAANRVGDRGLGTVGWSVPPFEIRLAPDGEVLFRGPSLFKGYWRDAAATAAVFDADGWYHTGDAGRFDERGRLVLTGRTRDMIVLPNGFNVFPEDIENELRKAGLRESVVLETSPGRIEAVVLPPDRPRYPTTDIPSTVPAGLTEPPAELRATIERAIRTANGRLGINQRIDGWRLWPAADFPRTHTLKVKRDQVRAWVAVEDGRDRATGVPARSRRPRRPCRAS